MGSISPYLFFDGDCAEAFARYQEVFGGELQVMTHADIPGDAEAMPGAEPHHVMHAALSFGDGVIMGSDDPGAVGSRGGIAVAFTAPDAATAERAFDALSEGGEMTMPFEATFWSLGFGMCTDRFGIAWMVDTEGEPGE